MSEIYQNFSIQILFTIGLIVAFGVIVWILNKVFYRLMGNKGKTACIITGFVGTPVHELGHAFFCLVFRHKIIEIKLYQPNNKDGVLGYVRHTYKKKSIYQQVGNFFIGIGPVIFGSAALLLLMKFLVPSLLNDVKNIFDLLSINDLSSTGTIVFEVLKSVFAIENMSNILWWVFMILACSIALHMSISIPDIKGSIIGLIYIIIVLFVINVIFYFVSVDLMYSLTDWCLLISSFILNFLMISVLLSLILVFISGIFKITGFGR